MYRFRQWALIPMLLGLLALAHQSGTWVGTAAVAAVFSLILVLALTNVIALATSRALGFTVPIVVSSGSGPYRYRTMGGTTFLGSTVPVFVTGFIGYTGDEADLSLPRYLAGSIIGAFTAAVATIAVLSIWVSQPVALMMIGIGLALLLLPIGAWRSLGVFRSDDTIVRAGAFDQLRANHYRAWTTRDPAAVLEKVRGYPGPHHHVTAAMAHLVLGDRAAALETLGRIPRPASVTVERAIERVGAMASAAQEPASAATVLRLSSTPRYQMDPVMLMAAVEAAVATGQIARVDPARLAFDRLAEWMPLHPALGQRLMDAYRHAGEPARLPALPPGLTEPKKAFLGAALTIGILAAASALIWIFVDQPTDCERGAERFGGRCVDGMVIVDPD